MRSRIQGSIQKNTSDIQGEYEDVYKMVMRIYMKVNENTGDYKSNIQENTEFFQSSCIDNGGDLNLIELITVL